MKIQIVPLVLALCRRLGGFRYAKLLPTTAWEASHPGKNPRIRIKACQPPTNSLKALDVGSTEINGPGISAAEIKIAAYGKRKFFFTAAPNSAMKLSNAKSASLSEGLSIQWSPDPDKDFDGKARLAIEVR